MLPIESLDCFMTLAKPVLQDFSHHNRSNCTPEAAFEASDNCCWPAQPDL